MPLKGLRQKHQLFTQSYISRVQLCSLIIDFVLPRPGSRLENTSHWIIKPVPVPLAEFSTKRDIYDPISLIKNVQLFSPFLSPFYQPLSSPSFSFLRSPFFLLLSFSSFLLVLQSRILPENHQSCSRFILGGLKLQVKCMNQTPKSRNVLQDDA